MLKYILPRFGNNGILDIANPRQIACNLKKLPQISRPPTPIEALTTSRPRRGQLLYNCWVTIINWCSHSLREQLIPTWDSCCCFSYITKEGEQRLRSLVFTRGLVSPTEPFFVQYIALLDLSVSCLRVGVKQINIITKFRSIIVMLCSNILLKTVLIICKGKRGKPL